MQRVPASAICHCCLNLAVGLLLVVAACSTDQTAGPSHTPDHVIRAYPNSCVPSVISTVTDSTETDLVTFDSILTSVCYPNLISWGIDMADPAGVDTPQGSANWEMRNDNVANLPSGSYYAWPDNGSIAQTVIEFDPPVSSVTFYYSRLQNQYARWGGQAGPADSMMVYARSRIPGTTFYNEWDSRKLFSNVPSTTAPWTVWTPVTLSANGDKIQWLWFDGNLVIDNLQITRKPLSCTGAQRGQQATCRVTPSGATVTSWEFVPDSSTDTLPAVQKTTSDTTWSGTVAANGMVTVHLTDGIAPRSFKARLNVTDRQYNWPSKWSYRAGPEQTVANGDGRTSNDAFGRNCPEEHAAEVACLAQDWSRIQPDPTIYPDSGFTLAKIADGPNAGYWYVSSISYVMHRVANVHPGMVLASTYVHQVPPVYLTNSCKHGLGLHGKVTSATANFYQMNLYCGPNGMDMTIFEPAIWGHESFGYNGGIGHETLAQQAAAEPKNDPYSALQAMVSTDSATLFTEARLAAEVIGSDIKVKAADNSPITGGPTNNYDPANYNRDTWFWTIGPSSFLEWVPLALTSKY
jgi:hypothetical protein